MCEFRTVYNAPCNTDRFCKPSYVQRRIYVAVPLSSARTGEAMLHAFSYCSASTARLRSISRFYKNNTYPNSVGFVRYKVLKLSKCPAMQTRSNTFPHPYMGADVSQVLHSNFRNTCSKCLRNNVFAGYVIHMLYMSLFSPRDSAQLSFGCATTIGLKAMTQSKVFVPTVPQKTAAQYLTGTCGCEIILSNINTHKPTIRQWWGVWDTEKKVKIPNTFTYNSSRFFGRSLFKQAPLLFANNKGYCSASRKGEKRKSSCILKGVRTFVEGNRRRTESNGRDRYVLADFTVTLQRFVSVSDTVYCLADHLATEQRKCFPHRIVDKVVQRYAIPTTVFLRAGNNSITRSSESLCKRRQRRRLLGARQQFQRHGSHHHIGPIFPLERCQVHFLPTAKAVGFLEVV